MSKIHLHNVGREFIAITGGKNGQVLTIPPETVGEIQTLLDERRRLGKELTEKLKSRGLVTASDDEETEVTVA